MNKAAPTVSDEVQVANKKKHTAYLIAVRHKRDAPRVYAVLAPSAETALAQLDGLITDGIMIHVVGALSREISRRLGLKAGEMRLI